MLFREFFRTQPKPVRQLYNLQRQAKNIIFTYVAGILLILLAIYSLYDNWGK